MMRVRGLPLRRLYCTLPVGLRQHVFELWVNLPLDDTECLFGQDFRFIQIFCVVFSQVDDDLRQLCPVFFQKTELVSFSKELEAC